GATRARRRHRAGRLADRRAPAERRGRRAEVVRRLGAGSDRAAGAGPLGPCPVGGGALPSGRQAGARAGRLPGPLLAGAAPPPGAGVPALVLRAAPGGRAAPRLRSGGLFPRGGACPRLAATCWPPWS